MIRSRKTLINQQDILSMKCQLISFVSLSLNALNASRLALKTHGDLLSTSVWWNPSNRSAGSFYIYIYKKHFVFLIHPSVVLCVSCCFWLTSTNGCLSMADQRWWTQTPSGWNLTLSAIFLPDCWLLPNSSLWKTPNILQRCVSVV